MDQRIPVSPDPERLASIVTRDLRKRFAWGRCDCVLWACDVYRELTGVDFAARFRGTYRTRRDAASIIAAHGGSVLTLARRIAEEYRVHEIPATMARRGDIVCVRHAGPSPFDLALSVCVGSRCVGPSHRGLMFVPLSSGIAAWSM